MFPDTGKNYWQLATIQAAALGLQGMMVGSVLATQYGAGVAITSICIGNLVL